MKSPLRIAVGIIVFNEPENILRPMLESCRSLEGHEVLIYLHRHSTREQYPDVARVCEEFKQKCHTCFYCPWEEVLSDPNRGLSASWNDSLHEGYLSCDADAVILPNADILFQRSKADGVHDLDRLARAMVDNLDKGIVTCMGWHNYYAQEAPHLGMQPWLGFGASLFGVQQSTIEKIGYFDENIRPCRLEDCDYFERFRRAGGQMHEEKRTVALHYGSLSSRVDENGTETHNQTYPASAEYYRNKWGSLPGQGHPNETPFGDPRFDLCIPAERRHTPYGPLYDRFDVAPPIPSQEVQ